MDLVMRVENGVPKEKQGFSGFSIFNFGDSNKP
jgi:hypothetical protein